MSWEEITLDLNKISFLASWKILYCSIYYASIKKLWKTFVETLTFSKILMPVLDMTLLDK